MGPVAFVAGESNTIENQVSSDLVSFVPFQFWVMTTCCCFRMCPVLKTSLHAALSECHLRKSLVKHCNLLNCSFSFSRLETAQMTSGFFFLVLLLESYVLEEGSRCIINSSMEKSHGEEMTSLTASRKKLMSPTNHKSKLTNRFPCPVNPADDNCILNCHFVRP